MRTFLWAMVAYFSFQALCSFIVIAAGKETSGVWSAFRAATSVFEALMVVWAISFLQS